MEFAPFLRAFALAVAVGGGLTALANARDAARADAAKGAAILEANCARCHAVGEDGTSPVAVAPAFRTLAQRYPVESLEEALAEGIMVGHRGMVQMPEFTFSPEEIGHIIAYLGAIQEP